MAQAEAFTNEEPGGEPGGWVSVRKLAPHGLAGSLAGYFILHPASVLLHRSFERQPFSFEAIFRESLSLSHLPMALYFTLLGMIFGSAYGIFHLRISQLYEKVKILSLTDPLTSLHNRRYLDERLEDEINRCNRYGRSLSLIIADLDHFKKFNDVYGHLMGDELLKAVAGRFRRLVRKPDFIARYGGEEFVVVMPETDCQKALHLAERMRDAIRKLSVPGSESQPDEKITASFGIAELPTHATDAASLIHQADQSLYQAKTAGRDRIVTRGHKAHE